MKRKLLALAAVGGLLTAPIAAQEIQLERASAPVSQDSELGGSGSLLFYLGIAAVAAAVVLLSEDEDSPVSA